jgi:hypothetical protein
MSERRYTAGRSTPDPARKMPRQPALKGQNGCKGVIRTGTLSYRLCKLEKGHEGEHQ